ncbi:3-methyl-2-oxobutanoate hydroxymethyltransferase [Salibacterium sp. K-3]
MKNSVTFTNMKAKEENIAMLTAYDAPSAKAAAKAGVDMILVGDSAGMVVHGYGSTIPVTLDDMLLHSKAVKRGAPDVFTVTDLPFLCASGSFDDTLQAVKRLMQEAGVEAVKLEGAGPALDVITYLSKRGIPVMGHLGLTPQSAGVLGGYKVQGRTAEEAEQIIKDAEAVEENGAFALVLECVPQELAAVITSRLSIPVIGIGAGSRTDGQVLVFHDVTGLTDGFVPSFVKQYADLQQEAERAAGRYVQDVRQGVFPGKKHSFSMDEEAAQKLSGGIGS